MTALDPGDRIDPTRWRAAVERAYDEGFTYLDLLTAIDHLADPGEPGIDVLVRVLHLWDRPAVGARVIRTRVADGAVLESLTPVFAGAAWAERELHEMFGIGFSGFQDGTDLGLRRLLLPAAFEGTPLRKSFVLAARAARPWPGAVEPGGREPAVGRRRARPHGIPDEPWGAW
ncbi:MAG: NADH-quinone oxidoreductase subunit C [Dermatophilaceae bacterium]